MVGLVVYSVHIMLVHNFVLNFFVGFYLKRFLVDTCKRKITKIIN